MPDGEDAQKANDDQSASQTTQPTTQTISIMFSAHSNIGRMVVISNIAGDRTPDGTLLLINGPRPLNAGHTCSMSFTDFLGTFESVVAYKNNFGIQNLASQLFYYASASSSSSSGSSDAPSGGSR
jgi:hypothetical protein